MRPSFERFKASRQLKGTGLEPSIRSGPYMVEGAFIWIVAERNTPLDYKCEPKQSGAELRHTSSVRYANMAAVNARYLSGRQNSATRQSCRRIHMNPHEIQVLSGDCYRIASPVPQANRGLTRELALNRRSAHLHRPPHID
jgi:hypothetical protein